MTYSFNSGFADDIRGMMEWRGMLGYTKSCYMQQMRDFDCYCCEKFPDACILTLEMALSYLELLRERRDIRVDVAALRNLGKYQVMTGKAACVFPADYFSYKKRKPPYIMSDEECRRFFEAADNYPYDKWNPLLSYTVAVFFRLQYAAGMRPQETRLLTRLDFDFVHDTVYIADSKRHKDRRIAVEHRLMETCRKYDEIARCIYPDTDIFFTNRNRKAHRAASIQNLFHKCWEMAGNPDGLPYCTPYILRHNFATRTITGWMKEGKDFSQYMPYLSAYMGHETFRETCYYLHLMPERISHMGCMDISGIIAEVPHED